MSKPLGLSLAGMPQNPVRLRPFRQAGNEDEADDGQRWMVSYADFITLLLAFFIVMYSISSVNDGKLQVLSQSMTAVFDPAPLVPIDLGGEAAPARALESSAVSAVTGLAADEDPADHAALALAGSDNLTAISQALSGPIEGGQVRLRQSADWTEIELDSRFLFDSGTAGLSNAAVQVIRRLLPMLQALATPIRVEGFTDDVPVADGQGSNWALSALRAAAVVDLLVDSGIAETRLSVTGFGPTHPIADNTSAVGRQRNRRVVIALARHGQVAAASVAAQDSDDKLPPLGWRRVTELPGPAGVSF